jgi:tRNA A37 threonylcarbamoyladenosine modification protein TsaB
MRCLAIEAGNPTVPPPAISGACVGVLVPGSPERCRVIAFSELAKVDRQRDDLLPCIERALVKAETGPEQIEAVAVSVGPGGFTSIRSAIAAGAMLAAAAAARAGRPVPCIGVPSVLSAWFGWRLTLGTGLAVPACAVALASKADTVFAAMFPALEAGQAGSAGAAVGAAADAKIVRAAEAEVWLRGAAGGVLLADGHLPEGFARAAAVCCVRVLPLSQTPASCLAAAAVCVRCETHELAAIYGREPEAVTLWRQRHGPRV